MKKLIILFLLFTSLFFVSTSPALAQGRESKTDRLFYSYSVFQSNSLGEFSLTDLTRVAKSTCNHLRQGNSIIDAFHLMEESGFTIGESLAFLSSTVTFYCPEQRYFF